MKCLIKHNIIIIIILTLPCPSFLFAQEKELCSPKGYTILTVNGMLTDEQGAQRNRDRLKDNLQPSYKNELVAIDYLFNPSHVGGVGDTVDVTVQKITENMVVKDYDLVELIRDASEKVKTQKLLLVAHSQGNFYANSFYNTITGFDKLPPQSFGIYGIANPASYIAGFGSKYITSSTDEVINKIRKLGWLVDVLPANVDIDLLNDIGSNGHSFSDTYLKYQGKRIVSDIEYSLKGLMPNSAQDSDKPCIPPPKITLLHKITGSALAFLDHPIDTTQNNIDRFASSMAGGMKVLVSLFKNDKLAVNNPASTVLATNQEEISEPAPPVETKEETPTPTVVRENNKEEIKKEVAKEPEPITTIESVVENIISQNITPFYVPTPSSGGGGARGSGQRVIVDTTPPNITILGDNPTNLVLGFNYTDAGATASDEQDGTLSVVTTGTVTKWIPGSYDIVYTATDVAGNVATATRTVNVADVVSFSNISTSDLNNNGTPDSDEADVVVDSNMSLPPGEYHFSNLNITNNAVLTLEGDILSTGDSFKGVKIVANNLTVDNGSHISADSKGYTAGLGFGYSTSSGVGASYGADNPGDSVDLSYGSAVHPTDLGSSGASLFYAGGAMRIIVLNNFINNGMVSSDGGRSNSGGSVFVTANNLEGSGIFRALGGDLYYTGYFKSPGTGGRVAVHYGTSSFSGSVLANGGCGSYDGFSMYCSPNGTAGMFDETNNNLYINNSWQFRESDSPFVFNNIFVSNNVAVRSDNGVSITADTISLGGASTLTLRGNEILNVDNLLVRGNSTVSVFPENVLSLAISNITIDYGSKISVDDGGYIVGPGTPDVYGTAGASYGGMGLGDTAKAIYGSDIAPVNFGSGTESRRGGGAIRLVVSGTLENNGIISANGNGDRTSGGSIYVTVNHLIGNGSFNANGSGGSWPTMNLAGGGGRVAIYYNDSLFLGIIEARGGNFCFSGVCISAGNGTVITDIVH